MRIGFDPGRARDLALSAAGGAAALAAWEVAVRASGTDVFPSPTQVALGIGEIAKKGVLGAYMGDSLRRVFAGFSIALLLGVPAGLLMGVSNRFEEVFDPVVQLLRPISPLAWIPVAILFFGITDFSAIFLIANASFFPIVVATANAVREVPVMYRRAGSNFGLPRSHLFLRVVLPAAAPRILTGLRITMGVSWLVVVAAEMIAIDSGLGYLVIDSRNAGKRYDLVVAGMLLIGLIGLALDAVFRLLERLPWLRWGFRPR